MLFFVLLDLAFIFKNVTTVSRRIAAITV